MSRNYDLMQGMLGNEVFPAYTILQPAPPIAEERDDRKAACQLPNDDALGLVQRIFQQPAQEPPRLVVFAAIDSGSGCSQIAGSAAASLALSVPGEVCLVDGNFRSPSLPRMMGTTNHRGFTDALLEPGSVRSFARPVCNQSLWLLSSGPVAADSPKLVTSERMKERFTELRREFDFVVVDAPPIKRYADAIALGKLSDGVVVVLEAGSTRREAARMAVENLRSARVKVLGAVLNKRTFPIPEGIYRRL